MTFYLFCFFIAERCCKTLSFLISFVALLWIIYSCFFTKSCLHIHHKCGVCFCSVLYTRHRFVVKSKHVLFVLYFIHLFLHFTPDPEKTVPSVCLCVCLSVVWTDSFSIGKYSRNPLYNTADQFSTKLVTSYPWVKGSHFFFFSNRLHTH